VGAQGLGHQDGGGAVRGADDADGGGVLQVEAQQNRDDDGQEDTSLSGGAAQEQLGVGQQGSKVDHGADAGEQQDGHGLTGLDADFKQPLNDTGGLTQRLTVLIDNTGQGQVDQNGAEAHGHQQRGLEPLDRKSVV